MRESIYFQDHMPENICFGCGRAHPNGLRIQSYWEGKHSVCEWQPKPEFQGWEGLLNGGIAAALIDCHCMCTAMAEAYRQEERPLHSKPIYRYATGALNVRYLHPTPITETLRITAQVLEVKAKKTILKANLSTSNTSTVEAEVIALRVYDSSQPTQGPFALKAH